MQLTVDFTSSKFGPSFKPVGSETWYKPANGVVFPPLNKGDIVEVGQPEGNKIKTIAVVGAKSLAQSPSQGSSNATSSANRDAHVARSVAVKAVLSNSTLTMDLNVARGLVQELAAYILTGKMGIVPEDAVPF